MLSFVVKHFVIFIWEKCYTDKFYLLTYVSTGYHWSVSSFIQWVAFLKLFPAWFFYPFHLCNQERKHYIFITNWNADATFENEDTKKHAHHTLSGCMCKQSCIPSVNSLQSNLTFFIFTMHFSEFYCKLFFGAKLFVFVIFNQNVLESVTW